MNEKIKDILEWIYCIIIAVVLALLFTLKNIDNK